jgi:serine/threonine protein kinase
MADRTGQLLGNYRLDKLLGHGSFAEVYRGQHIHLNTPAAIKILFATELNSPGAREVFLLEARTIAELAHPHIVEIKDFSIDQNIPFLVMEYAPKGSLLNNYPSGSQLFLPTILAYVEQIAFALQYAHEHKKIHRDVKPANILVRNDGSVMLGDFGIATITHNTSSRQTVDISGTYAYMAPEQMNGHPCPASDQYALAIMVYEWIAGCLPFHGTMTELIAQHITAHPPSLVILVPTLPQAVEQVIFRALAKNPKDRFASVQEFAQALRSAAQTFADFIAATSPARPTDEANQRTPFLSMPITEPQTKPPAHQTFYSDITSPEMVHSANHKPFASREASIRTSNIASMQDLLYFMDEALADEIQAKRDDQKNVKHTAIDGELVFEANQRFIYAFHLDGIWEPEDETPMIVEFSDPALQSIKCTIVNATGNAITIATDSPLPAEALQKIWLVDDSAALLERLRERLQHSDEGKALLGSKSFGFLPYPIRSLAPTVAFGKEFLPDTSQQRAISQAFGSEVTYIIGPPGTGKTYALAAIAFVQFCAGRTVLIAANTNIAVDNAIMRVAKICRDSRDANASRALSMGQIIRYGTPQLEDQLKEDYKEIHLPSVVKQRSRQLNQEQEGLRDQLRGLMHQQEALEKVQLQQHASYPAPGGNSTFVPAESTYEQSKNLLTRLFTKGPTQKPITYPCLRVEIPEIKEHLLRGVPPSLSAPASMKTANLQIDGCLSALQTAKGHGLTKLASELAIGAR